MTHNHIELEKNFRGIGVEKIHKTSSKPQFLPPPKSRPVQALFLTPSCSKFPHFYKCSSSPFSSHIPFTVPVFSFTFLQCLFRCEHLFPCLFPLLTINFTSMFQQRHHVSSQWFKFWCMIGFHSFQNYLEQVQDSSLLSFTKGTPAAACYKTLNFMPSQYAKKLKENFFCAVSQYW